MSRQCPVGIGRRRANSTLSGRLGYWRGGRWNGMMFGSLVPGKSPATDVPPAPRQLMGDRLAGLTGNRSPAKALTQMTPPF